MNNANIFFQIPSLFQQYWQRCIADSAPMEAGNDSGSLSAKLHDPSTFMAPKNKKRGASCNKHFIGECEI